jgi:hypothetical protein
VPHNSWVSIRWGGAGGDEHLQAALIFCGARGIVAKVAGKEPRRSAMCE